MIQLELRDSSGVILVHVRTNRHKPGLEVSMTSDDADKLIEAIKVLRSGMNAVITIEAEVREEHC
jgi:hypothetical protein